MSALHKSYSFKLESHVVGRGNDLPQMLSSFVVHYDYDPFKPSVIDLRQIYMVVAGKVTEMPHTVFSEKFKQSLKKQILMENNSYH